MNENLHEYGELHSLLLWISHGNELDLDAATLTINKTIPAPCSIPKWKEK